MLWSCKELPLSLLSQCTGVTWWPAHCFSSLLYLGALRTWQWVFAPPLLHLILFFLLSLLLTVAPTGLQDAILDGIDLENHQHACVLAQGRAGLLCLPGALVQDSGLPLVSVAARALPSGRAWLRAWRPACPMQGTLCLREAYSPGGPSTQLGEGVGAVLTCPLLRGRIAFGTRALGPGSALAPWHGLFSQAGPRRHESAGKGCRATAACLLATVPAFRVC